MRISNNFYPVTHTNYTKTNNSNSNISYLNSSLTNNVTFGTKVPRKIGNVLLAISVALLVVDGGKSLNIQSANDLYGISKYSDTNKLAESNSNQIFSKSSMKPQELFNIFTNSMNNRTEDSSKQVHSLVANSNKNIAVGASYIKQFIEKNITKVTP